MRSVFLSALIAAICFGCSTSPKEQGFFREAVAVWPQGKQLEQNVTAAFRAVVDYDGRSDVQLNIAASSDYRAWVNGEFLGHGPCVAAHGFFRVDEYDLKDRLVKGRNIIAIEAAGYNVDNFYLPNQPSFVQAEVTSRGKVLAATATNGDKAFEAFLPGQRVQQALKYSFQRTFVESYSLQDGFDAWIKDASVALPVAALEQTDNKALIERRVKYPDYTVRKPVEQMPGNIYRFECNSTGFIGARIEANTPSEVVLTWDELLTGGDVNIGRLRCNSTLTYKLEPGVYDIESFEPYTLQYLKVTVNSGDCSVSAPYIRQYVNSDTGRASFACSNTDLDKIFAAATETFRQNALDVFMDCPSRERAGWLCDSYFASRVAFDLSGNTLIEKNFFENYLLPGSFQYLPEGMLPMCYPADHADYNFIPNWAMWFVLELQEYGQRSGDTAMVKALEPKVMALVDYFKPFENSDGLLEKLDKWVFIEWSRANEFVQDVSYPTNMLYAQMLDVAGSLYAKPELTAQAAAIRETIRSQSFDGTFFRDNAVRTDGKLAVQNNRTETCQYYAFYFGIATPESHSGLWSLLLDKFGPKRNSSTEYADIYPSNAFMGNYMRMEILSRYGHVKQMLGESADFFLYMANTTGTLWENVSAASVWSCCHGFASHVAHVFYRDLLGIARVDAPGRKVDIAFNETGMDWCKGTMPVGGEAIVLEWRKEGGNLRYSLALPEGYEANVVNKTGLELVKGL